MSNSHGASATQRRSRRGGSGEGLWRFELEIFVGAQRVVSAPPVLDHHPRFGESPKQLAVSVVLINRVLQLPCRDSIAPLEAEPVCRTHLSEAIAPGNSILTYLGMLAREWTRADR